MCDVENLLVYFYWKKVVRMIVAKMFLSHKIVLNKDFDKFAAFISIVN